MSKSLREVWESNRPNIGGWCTIPSAFSSELMGRAGYDWVCVDTQHGLIGHDQMATMLATVAIAGTPTFVRVTWNQPDHIMKALDAGAQGIIVPMVSSADEARQAVTWAKYPPLGIRSWGPIRAALGVDDYTAKNANRRTVVIPMIETPGAMENLDEILSIDGVDGVFVGPADLGLSHGLTPTLDVTDPQHEKLILRIAEACQQHGVVAGIHCDNIQTVHRWLHHGYRMFTISSDAAFIRVAATNITTSVFADERQEPIVETGGQYA
jgi:4-hydroxy-2-oxoheptanedioate aldolase